MRPNRKRSKKVAFYGHFDSTNLGNESTLQAIIYHIRRFRPECEVTCICTGPAAAQATHNVTAIPLADGFFAFSAGRTRLTRWLRRLGIWLPGEVARWVQAFTTLRRTDMLIVPGTGLLTDAYGLFGWGTWTLLKWSMMARFRRCRLLFISVGAGPFYSTPGRWLVRLILSLAEFRSYRDRSTVRCLDDLGVDTRKDSVFPDLAFSLPESAIPRRGIKIHQRNVVGLGVMEYAGRYSGPAASDAIYRAYLESLAAAAKWLLSRECEVRLLIGDFGDVRAKNDLRSLLEQQLRAPDLEHLIDEPVQDVKQLLSQIAATDIVVATRFHNIVFALLCAKPVISISFHEKCRSLMNETGLSRYSLEMNDLTAAQLISRLGEVETNMDAIVSMITAKVNSYRKLLESQYEVIFSNG